MVLLAVYGTLKQGHHNHRVKLDRDPVFGGYVDLTAEMFTNGRYPMLVKRDQTYPIFLEIYQLTEEELVSIDELEEPFGYHREEIDIKEHEHVWIYYYTAGTPPDEFRRVEDGNFVAERSW